MLWGFSDKAWMLSGPPVASTSQIPLLAQEPANFLPARYGFHVATLQFRSYTAARPQLDMAVEFARRSAYALKIPCGRPAALPISTELLTVPKGPFVHKKSQENFWRRTHRRVIKVWDADEQVIQVWLEYLRQNPLPGVGIKAQQFLYRPVGFGDSIKQSQSTSDFVQVNSPDAPVTESTQEQLARRAQEVSQELSQEQDIRGPVTTESESVSVQSKGDNA